uniref:Uncharacterized protein n=1 Tax=Wuhan insect virus 30 TaxID=1923734 RepID=A0A1L3KF47_9VIRU|nr:hypothetical protein [Wuhan insect virus 30]
MSAFNRVMDYFKGMPDNKNHRDVYVDKFIEKVAEGKMESVDFVSMEKSILGPGERNLIRAFSAQSKFTLNSMANGFNLHVMSTATSNDRGNDMCHEASYKLDFMSDRHWYLNPSTSRVNYSTRSTTIMAKDKALRSKLAAACRNMSGAQSSSMNIIGACENLSIPSNMEHIFTKIYLILCDYNLAATSKSGYRQTRDDIRYKLLPNITPTARVSAIMNHDIVVDSGGFTKQELGLLCLAGLEYPSVWYCGDNIYNACQMEADDLVIVSPNNIDIDSSLAWGSPDRLYNVAASLACKLGAVSCMMKAFGNMRGKCQMMKDMREFVEHTEVASGMTKSINYSRALGGPNVYDAAPGNAPGYLSTSYSLIVDLLLGMQYKASATCVVEELGGYGSQLCGKLVSIDRTFNGLARDYGLDHADNTVNVLLLNWASISGSPISWGFGDATKAYVVQLASYMQQDIDLLMPQIMSTIPYTHTPNTAWGYCRGWEGLGRPTIDNKKDIATKQLKLASFGWMVGITPKRPKVFRNASHKAKPVTLSPELYRLESRSESGYTLKMTKMFMADSLGGRVDESERTAESLFKTEYAGTECTLIYDREAQIWTIDVVEPPPNYDRLYRESVRGEVLEEDVASDISPVTYGGAPPVSNDVMEKVKALGVGSTVKVSNQKRHVRVGSTGTPFVATYNVKGKPTQEPLKDNDPDVNTGDVVSLSEIDVPGDGQCALHAVMEDLKAHGYVDQVSATRVQSNFNNSLSTDDFHDAQEVAGMLMNWGFGLDLYDERNGETEMLRYGDDNVRHRVTLLRRGNHFSAVRYGGGKTTKINKVTRSQQSNEELIKDIEKFRKFFSMN